MMGTPAFAPPLHIGHTQKHRRSVALFTSRKVPYSCLKRSEQTRTKRQEQLLAIEQWNAEKLSLGIRASEILEEDDIQLFETFTYSRAELFLRVLNNRTRHVTFVLDGVHGAHNLAAIARSCDAWGVQDLHLISQSGKVKNGENSKRGTESRSLIQRFEKEKSVQNVSKNAHKWLTIQEHNSVNSCLEELKSSGYRIFVSSLSSSATSIQEIDVSSKCAFVFGNERRGVSKEMEAQADGRFTIPMMGFVESMNVSVAVGATASLTISRSREKVPPVDYALRRDEKRELAHIWLMNHFSSKGPPKAIPSSADVTRLGAQRERQILQDGMFVRSEHYSFDPRNPQTIAVRLSDDAGARLAKYVNRTKFGILGDGHFDKRCKTIAYCLAGAHALSCAAALRKYEFRQISRSKLVEYFAMVCDRIKNLYFPYFDTKGIPTLPTFAPESQQVFDRLSALASNEALHVCLQMAQDLFDLEASAAQVIIERASYRDLSRCVTDTLRLSEEESRLFQREVTRCLPNLPDLMGRLQERESVHNLGNSYRDGTISGSQRSDVLPIGRLAVLQVFLRLSHAAHLSSEMHQAIWDRSTTRSHLKRLHSQRFGLLEYTLCEAWAECVTIPSFNTLGPLRLVVQLDQALVALQLALKSNDVENTNVNLFQDVELRNTKTTETVNCEANPLLLSR